METLIHLVRNDGGLLVCSDGVLEVPTSTDNGHIVDSRQFIISGIKVMFSLLKPRHIFLWEF